jgi:hypothetical protein
MNFPEFINDLNIDSNNIIRIISNIDTELSAEEKADIFCLELTKLVDIEDKYNYYWDKSTEFFSTEQVNESLPRKSSVEQLKKVMRKSSKTDIGNRISDMNKQGANIQYIRNPIKTGIESFEDFEHTNKKFISSWNNLGLLDPYKNKNKK